MLNVITTETITRDSGETVQVTEWTIGAYTLRKAEEPNYTGWVVLTADRNLPRIDDNSADLTPEFGVSCYSESGLTPSGAVAYAGQIMEASEAAKAFNEIVAAN